MPTLDPSSVANFGNCLSGTADYSLCPHSGYQQADTWLDGLMEANMVLPLLTSPPCSMIQDDAAQVKSALNTLSNYTYTQGSTSAPFWDHVVDLFAARSAARKTAARDLATTAAQLARDNPNLTPDEIAARAELEQLLKALNGGY